MDPMEQNRVIVLIPAYKPDERLITLTRELIAQRLDVLLVDDGGKETYAPVFEACRALGAAVEVHAVNQGKGRALKTGINAALLRWPDVYKRQQFAQIGMIAQGEFKRLLLAGTCLLYTSRCV